MKNFKPSYKKNNDTLWVTLPGMWSNPDDFDAIIPPNDSHLAIHYDPPFTSWELATQTLTTIIQDHARHHHPVYLLGYSMGGRMIQAIQHALQNHIAGTLLISSGVPLTDPDLISQKTEFEQTVKHNMHHKSPLEFFKWWFSLPLYNGLTDHPDFDALIHQKATTIQPLSLEPIITDWSVRHMTMPSQTCRIPTHYIYGEKDTKYAKLSTQLPMVYDHITCHSIPNSSHYCLWENPAAISRIMTQVTNDIR